MKNNIKLLLAAVAAMVLMADCTREESPVESVIAKPATISVSIPADGLTKVDLTQDANPDGPVKLTWESTDAITVENADDDTKSVVFNYLSGAGTASATFSTADVSPLDGATSYNIYLTSNMPGGYTHQTQASNASTDHLGYAATLSGVDTFDGIVFSQGWTVSHGGSSMATSSVLRIRAQLPTTSMANSVKKVIVKSSAPIFDEGNELDITITTPGSTDKIVTVYATLPPGDVNIASGTELLFQFQVSDDVHDKYTSYRKTTSAQTLGSGKVNVFKINCPNIESYAGKDDDGTEANPYLIGDRHQMDAMHTLLGSNEEKFFKMVDDVDLAAINPWEPLCTVSDDNKHVHFDGSGHCISNLTADATYNYPSFFGFLWGEVKNVVFDGASITCNDEKDKSGGVVAGYIGRNSNVGQCEGVTIRNSTLTSGGGSAYLGGLAARIGNASKFSDCHVINTTLTSASGNVGGLLAYIASNTAPTILDCSAERVTVTGGGTGSSSTIYYVGGLIGIINTANTTVRRCHSSGTVQRGSGNPPRHYGGLIGSIQKAGVQILYSYSTCDVSGAQWTGGLVGTWWTTGGSGLIDHCFASGKISDNGNSGDGGLVGSLEVPGITVSNCVAWNSTIAANKHGEGNYSSGAVIGRAHPQSILTDNYRKPGMSITAYWVPSANFDHPNSQQDGEGVWHTWRIGTDLVEGNGAYTTETTLATPNGTWAYHGKHLASGAVVEPDDTYGWVSNDISGGSAPDTDPEAAGWTDTPTLDLSALNHTSYSVSTIRDGVQYTHFHGQWQGEWREINIVRTTLNEHNRLGVYYNYQDDGLLYLNDKCEFVDAIAGTNGSMACCHFVRIDDAVKHAATSTNPWTANCALTIDNGVVNIVKVTDNFAAAMLPNRTVSCAGPLLVWKGNVQYATSEWLALDSEDWLTDTHPRTAIGLSKDGKTVIQVTVDGRWDGSGNNTRRAVGMSTDMLAELMCGLGCYKAMNFDGGGGTQMWIYGEGDVHNIVNHPHNTWPVYGTESSAYYWIKNNEVSRRTTGSAVYIYSDLK